MWNRPLLSDTCCVSTKTLYRHVASYTCCNFHGNFYKKCFNITIQNMAWILTNPLRWKHKHSKGILECLWWKAVDISLNTIPFLYLSVYRHYHGCFCVMLASIFYSLRDQAYLWRQVQDTNGIGSFRFVVRLLQQSAQPSYLYLL